MNAPGAVVTDGRIYPMPHRTAHLEARRVVPATPQALSMAASGVILDLYKLAEREGTRVDWPTISIQVACARKGAYVIATADRAGA